jgi:hypothetical protein
MPEKKPSETIRNQNPANTEKTPPDKKLERTADDAAKQAEKTEQRYDEDHEIFTN